MSIFETIIDLEIHKRFEKELVVENKDRAFRANQRIPNFDPFTTVIISDLIQGFKLCTGKKLFARKKSKVRKFLGKSF